jgi:2'-5' RNA ligase
MSGDKKRLFVAVDVPTEIKEIYGSVLEKTRDKLVGARWVDPCNLHLTMKFVGPYEEERLAELIAEVRRVAERTPGFDMALGSLGAFPSRSKARVIWVGMTEGKEEARKLAQKLDARLEKVGVGRENRPFRGHLTLARLKRPSDCTRHLGELERELGGLQDLDFGVDEIVVYESRLSPKGPTYIPLEHLPLGGT